MNNRYTHRENSFLKEKEIDERERKNQYSAWLDIDNNNNNSEKNGDNKAKITKRESQWEMK